ncbi:hypothetical protein D9619_001014 [Psilocybe cf. subviscida]|uniref:Uncharacterized protein n=1 Tax=Psilocybe cf. subviscida TaxID=2480587 RepID=A0A8H5BFR9_9AGAR|nr:hypothetical protein D9619_001014 [Psilocybe cf. subviscida]
MFQLVLTNVCPAPSTFQQAVVRNLNDKNAQLQKQLDNVVREANAELTLLNSKKDELERDLELERRKVRELQDGSRERDKEYAKLKLHFDKLKRKTLFGPGAGGNDANGTGASGMPQPPIPFLDDQRAKQRQHPSNQGLNANLTAVIDGMEANGVQRTPLVARPNGTAYMTNPQAQQSRGIPHRQPFPAYTTGTGDTSYISAHPTTKICTVLANKLLDILSPTTVDGKCLTRSQAVGQCKESSRRLHIIRGLQEDSGPQFRAEASLYEVSLL